MSTLFAKKVKDYLILRTKMEGNKEYTYIYIYI